MWRDLFARFRRCARLTITCPHGTFVAATYAVGKDFDWIACEQCPLKVRLTWFRRDDEHAG